MDIKLKKKFKIVVFFLIIGLSSCKVKESNSQLNSYYGIKIAPFERMPTEDEAGYWVRTYKQQVFFTCLNVNLKNKDILILLNKEDLINGSDFIPFPFWAKKYEIAQKAIHYMQAKNQVYDEFPEDTLKRHVSKTCLNYMMSRELDSIAKNEYKKFKKMNHYEIRKK